MSHLFVVQLDIPAEHEAEFNRIYDTEHFPMLLKVPGVQSGARYRLEHSTVPGMQRYLTIYEIDSPEVLNSGSWEKAGAFGGWAGKIRPKLTARHHSVFERIA
jgi:allophanate hydrolase subunit 2